MKRALVVGVTYEGDAKWELKGSKWDAEAVRVMLKDNGYDVTVPDKDNQSRDAVIAAFTEMVMYAKAGDHFVFYFAGHGVQRTGMRAVDKKAITPDDLRPLIYGLPEGCQMLFMIDCCHAAQMVPVSFNLKHTPERINRLLLTEEQTKADVFVLASCADSQITRQAYNLRPPSCIAWILANLLKTTCNKPVKVNELLGYVQTLVAARYPYQTPQFLMGKWYQNQEIIFDHFHFVLD